MGFTKYLQNMTLIKYKSSSQNTENKILQSFGITSLFSGGKRGGMEAFSGRWIQVTPLHCTEFCLNQKTWHTVHTKCDI